MTTTKTVYSDTVEHSDYMGVTIYKTLIDVTRFNENGICVGGTPRSEWTANVGELHLKNTTLKGLKSKIDSLI